MRLGQKCTILGMKFSPPTRWSQNRRYERTWKTYECRCPWQRYPNKVSMYIDYSVGGKPVYYLYNFFFYYFISWNFYKIMLISNYEYYALNLKLISVSMWYLSFILFKTYWICLISNLPLVKRNWRKKFPALSEIR